MDLHNRLLILLFPNAYVKFRLVCGWLQEILGGFGWFQVFSCFSSYRYDAPYCDSIVFVKFCSTLKLILDPPLIKNNLNANGSCFFYQ